MTIVKEQQNEAASGVEKNAISEKREPEKQITEIVKHHVEVKEKPIEDLILATAFQETVEEQISNELQSENPAIIKADPSRLYFLALGDSLTKGVGDEEQKSGYTKRLVEKIEQSSDLEEVVLDNRGKRGRKSDQLLELLEKGHYDNELKNAELITITIGGNDIMKVVKKDLFELKRKFFDDELVGFENRYKQILKEIRIKNPDVPIIVVGLYNPFSVITDEITEFESIIADWNESIEATSKQYDNACYVDIQDLFDENANLVYHTDFFHPNGYGYTIMTERIFSMIKSCQVEDGLNGLILTD